MIEKSLEDEIKSLINFLNSKKKLTAEEIHEKYSPYYKKTEQMMISTGLCYGEITSSPGMLKYNADYDAFKAQLKKIDNNLAEQVKTVNEGVMHYFNNGEYPPPYYAMRICIILRKNKCYELEYLFLEAFCSKFSDGIGTLYQLLLERLEKAKKLFTKHKGL